MVAGMMMALSAVDVYWLVVPAYEQAGPKIGPMLLDIVMVVLIGAVWLWCYQRELQKLPLLPLHDPRFEGELQHEHGD